MYRHCEIDQAIFPERQVVYVKLENKFQFHRSAKKGWGPSKKKRVQDESWLSCQTQMGNVGCKICGGFFEIHSGGIWLFIRLLLLGTESIGNDTDSVYVTSPKFLATLMQTTSFRHLSIACVIKRANIFCATCFPGIFLRRYI